jgi:signal transduction histidine kinase
MAGGTIKERMSPDSAEFHEALFEYNPCQTIVVDCDGRIVTYNRAKRQSGDRLPQEGDVMFKDYAGRDDGQMYDEMLDCMRTGQTKEFAEQKYQDRYFSITISPFPGGAIIISEDVTDRRKAREELQRSEEFNRALFEFNPCQTIVVDREGRIITWNKAKGESKDRLPSQGDVIFREYAGRYECDMFSELTECMQEGQTRRYPDQKYIDKYLTTTISPFPGGATIITEDVTKRVETEKALADANEVLEEKDRLKTAFVSSMAHELRTALCILNNAISNIDAGAMGKINRKVKETVEMAGGSVHRLARVVDDFVELSDIELGNVELSKDNFDIRALCQEVIAGFDKRIKDKGIRLKTIIPDVPCLVEADRKRMGNVLRHLLDNAVKFVAKQGEVEFQLENRGRDVAMYVKDNGPGIARENLEKIFECFERFDIPHCGGLTGLGLGLTLAKGTVELHGGEIIVASTPGKSTTFRVVIPR